MKFLHMNANKIDIGKLDRPYQNELEIKKMWIGENMDSNKLVESLCRKND